MTLFIKGLKDFSEITGELKVSEVSNHSEDDDFDFDFSTKFKPEDNKNSSVLLSKIKSKSEAIQDYIKQIFKQFKDTLIQ